MTDEVKAALSRLSHEMNRWGFDEALKDCATIRAALEQSEREREADVLSWGNAAIEAQQAETAAVERAELAEREREALESELRQVLFDVHGCSGKYGDDGEMQCSLNPLIDFKRMPLDEVRKRHYAHQVAAASAAREAEFKRGWRTAFAEVAISIPCDAETIYKGELWVEKLIAAKAAAREQGRREGLEQAAKIADDRESEWSRDYQMMLVPSEHMLGKAHGAREIAAAIHAAKEVK